MAATDPAYDGRYILPKKLRDLLDDPTPVLIQVGRFLDREMRGAFARRSFGGVAWPEQYPGQSEPWIHFAGAIGDLAKSPNILARRFQSDHQPLKDSGELFNSIKSQPISKSEVEAGVLAHIDYASKHNEPGGESTIPIEGNIRKNLFVALRRARGRVEKAEKGKKSSESSSGSLFAPAFDKKISAASDKLDAIKKLGFLFSVDIFEQDIAWRPFVGITDRAKTAIPKLVKAIFEGRPVEQMGGL